MKERLRRFYHAHLDSCMLKGMLKTYRAGKGFVVDSMAAARLLKWKIKHGNVQGPIRICFLQQDPNCWNKSKGLYDYLISDPSFQVSLLCVPDPFDPDTGSTYRFFHENGYDAIDARVGNGPWDTQTGQGLWYDLASLNPEYVLYQQPYDHYLPECYRSAVVSRYTKICITLYGIVLTEEIQNCVGKEFYRNVYRMYAISESERKHNKNRFPISHKLGLRNSVYYGPLALVSFYKERESASDSWAFSRNSFRVIWTPRWTTNEILGGSNFFRYKDFLPQYADEHPDVDILFRPHPMAFDNFIRTGKMTEKEVVHYISACNSRNNTSIDSAKNYDATFWQSSVLMTDLSSIIVEYFITGKPIIFCMTENPSSTFLDFFQDILTTCYIAKNQDDVTYYLEELKAGNDPLKEKRLATVEKLFGADITKIPARIAADIVADHTKGKTIRLNQG